MVGDKLLFSNVIPIGLRFMRKFAIPLITFALMLSGIELNPAQASTYNGISGSVDCSGGYFYVDNNVVTNHSSCRGSATIPEGITAIGSNAFYSANELGQIAIPSTVTSIGVSAFEHATMANITFAPHSQLKTINNYAFRYANTFSTIEIPASVTSIGDGAFWGSLGGISFLNTVTFEQGSKLEIIGNSAFKDRPALTSISIPSSVTSIGGYAFQNSGLETVTFGSGSRLKEIGSLAFDGTSISNFLVPASVTTIGQNPFGYFSNLEFIGFESGSQIEIDNWFYGSLQLHRVELPASIKTIKRRAFWNQESLQSITFGPNSQLTSIGFEAFKGATSLTSIVIPAGVTRIDSGTFSGATQLNSVYLLGNPIIDSQAFFETEAGSEIIAPPTLPSKPGFSFNGWSESHGGNVITFPYRPNLSSAIVLYAKWSRNNEKAAASKKPSITGTAKAKKTLTAKKGTWNGYPVPKVSFQWYACSGAISSPRSAIPTSCKKITGATKSTFKIARAQKGKYISVLVTGISSGTSKTTWLSKSTSKVK